eukprot:CAMPEP_0172497154 /NCGR_PEP_ID=MMETSP1066-20121228/96092_1 /TAXON_ID=671091 /ORGANISM="Coscinodiscus wailesii, Strain CCMP2513" /LENGTH=120 /DNA_ID=CAMNT_0013269777 /DNA_START=9 /DNA_END=371 /DNA_ORIENTATION=-
MTRQAVEGWDPFVSLVRAHCGLRLDVPRCFTPRPETWVRHLFLPYTSTGTVVAVDGADFDRFGTHHSNFVLAKCGEYVTRTTDITKCSAFVWLMGRKEDVDADTDEIFRTFFVSTTTETR